MQTVTLRAIKHPSRLGLLLRELVQTFDVVPGDAQEVCDLARLPSALRRFVRCAAHLDASWACWLDDAGHAWFYFAEMPLELSRGYGKPVLQIDRYDEHGIILETSKWLDGADGAWSRMPANKGRGPAMDRDILSAAQRRSDVTHIAAPAQRR